MKSFDACVAPESAGLDGRERLALRVGGVDVVSPHLDGAAARNLCDALRSAREPLLVRPVRDIAATLGRVGARFADRSDDLRKRALEGMEATTGLSGPMCETVLDGMARDWSEARLARLLESEFDHPNVLDGLWQTRGRLVGAVGPELCVQVLSGSVPGVGVTALIRSLLVKAPTLLKPGAGDLALPVLFARALAEEDAQLAEALAVVYWPGGSTEVEEAALGSADAVVVYGSDSTTAQLRRATPVTTRFIAYHHRESIAAIGSEALSGDRVRGTARSLARAVALFDQRGCVSPHVVHIEDRDGGAAGRLGHELAEELAVLEQAIPGGPLAPEEAAALHQFRGTVELLAGSGVVGVRHGGAEATWTVVVDSGSGPAPLGAGRVVVLRPMRDADELPSRLAPHAEHLQTLGVAGFGARLHGLALECGRVGVTRVTDLESMPFPPAWWLHDGRGPLTELVRWVELEEG